MIRKAGHPITDETCIKNACQSSTKDELECEGRFVVCKRCRVYAFVAGLFKPS